MSYLGNSRTLLWKTDLSYSINFKFSLVHKLTIKSLLKWHVFFFSDGLFATLDMLYFI